MTGLSVPVSEFSKLRADRVLDVTKETTYGRACGDLFYNKEADLLLVSQHSAGFFRKSLRYIKPSHAVCDFYMWDNQLNKWRDREEMAKRLRELRESGVTKLVGMDFSLWYGQPAPTLINNLYYNLLRTRQAQDAGFDVALNWNWIMLDFEKVYPEVIPAKVPLVIVDQNHKNANPMIINREIAALKMFLQYCQPKTFLIQTARVDLSYMGRFLSELVKHDIDYRFVPSQTTLMFKIRAKQQRDKANGKTI